MTLYSAFMAILLIAQIIGWGIILSGFLRGGGAIDEKPIRTWLFILAIGCIFVSCVGGLAETFTDNRPFYMPLILGRLGGASLAWAIIALHHEDYFPFWQKTGDANERST